MTKILNLNKSKSILKYRFRAWLNLLSYLQNPWLLLLFWFLITLWVAGAVNYAYQKYKENKIVWEYIKFLWEITTKSVSNQ